MIHDLQTLLRNSLDVEDALLETLTEELLRFGFGPLVSEQLHAPLLDVCARLSALTGRAAHPKHVMFDFDGAPPRRISVTICVNMPTLAHGGWDALCLELDEDELDNPRLRQRVAERLATVVTQRGRVTHRLKV